MTQMSDLHDTEAERSILGAVISKPDILYEIQGELAPDDFSQLANRRIWEGMLELAGKRKPVELVSLADQLRESGTIDEAGGLMNLTSVMNTVSTAAYVKRHIEIVRGYSRRRRLMILSSELQQKAGDVTDELDLPDMQSKLAGIAAGQSDSSVVPFKTRVLDFTMWMDNRAKNGNKGVLTGLAPLDILTHGWQPTQLIILAARPSMGKSAMALQYALGAAINYHKSVAYFSLEMSENQLIARMVANKTGINSMRISNPGDLGQADWDAVYNASNQLAQESIFTITDCNTPMDIYSRCQQIAGQYGLDLVIIDHIHLMQSGKKNDSSRVQEVTYISRQLKLMAMDLKVPVIALSQLSRGVEMRDDKHPHMSDLRDSGSIEQDADMILTLYRDQYYYPNPQAPDTVEVSIIKNRDGALGSVELAFQKETSHFSPCPFSGRVVSGREIPV